MFQPFEGVPDYPKLEKEVLEFWETRQIFQKLRQQTENGPRFDFQDGPITANNPMGVHHAWGRTYKDIFNRFYAMKGRKLRWQNGFDCQGLWVEVEVEKALGFKGKPDILAFGMENFSRECRQRVEKYAEVIAGQSKRLGMWMDWERSYFTYDDSNIEHIWLFLQKCHEEGWLGPDYRVMPWCPRCETSLSQHESADSYKDVTHRSVYLKFPVLPSQISIDQELGSDAERLCTGTGQGENRAVDAAHDAVSSASLWATSMSSRQLLIAIESNEAHATLTIGEVNDIVRTVCAATGLKEASLSDKRIYRGALVCAATGLKETEVSWAAVCDPNLIDEIRVSLFAVTNAASAAERVWKLDQLPRDHFLVWTTTPWTLTANVALAVNPELTYVCAKTDDVTVILSKGTLQSALKPGYEIIEEISGADLVGRAYSGPFDDIPFQIESNKVAPRRVVAADWVGETDGTGIVHIAPGCGADDYDLGKAQNLGFIAPVTTSAHFRSECGDELAGLHALEDAEIVFAQLEKRGRLYRIQRYKHSYPHCWRCSHELIFFATQEWFIKADAGERPARGRLQRAAGEVNWVPEYAGKRMQDWLNNMGDWNISRKRFWGLPLPVWRDEETGEWDIIGSRAELRERAVEPEKVDALPELHRPWIDEIEIWSRDKTKKLTRIPEVGDAWLDAGIVPFSTVGYNGADDIRMPELKIDSKDAWQSVNFITEMREQVRLWFFSMLFMSVALEDRAPYKTAMVYETMLDVNGERLAKRLQNGVPFGYAVTLTGADPMRWTFCSNPLNKDIRFGIDPRVWPNSANLTPPDGPMSWDVDFKPKFDTNKPPGDPIHESARKLLTLWNVYSFFVTYANLDQPELGELSNSENILDRWILARLQSCIAGATEAVESIEPARITREIESFVDELSNWYVRRSRRRFWKSESDLDKNAAYRTLHHVLLTLSKLIAPVLPFSAENIYRNLSSPLENASESVHLCAWPVVDENLRDDELVHQVEGVLQAVTLGLSARKDSKIRARQPLSKALIQAPDASGRAGIEAWRDTILDELNIKEIELLDDVGDLVTYSLKANLPVVGKRFGKQVGALRQLLENAVPAEAKRIGEATKRGESVEIEMSGEKFTLEPGDILVQTHQQSGYSFASENGWSVALDTTLSEALEDEGFARDFVRAVQQARKEADFQVSDRISILLVDPDTETRLPAVLESFGDYIQGETLADELRFVDASYPELTSAKIGEETLWFRVERVV